MTQEQLDALMQHNSTQTTDEIQPNFDDVKVVADNIDDVINVSSALTDDVRTDINANLADIVTTATNIDDVVTTSNNITDVNTVANELNQKIYNGNTNSSIEVVANYIDNVNTVGSNIDAVLSVNDNEDNINTVATNIIPNLAEILQAGTNASTATTQADIATEQAGIATEQAVIATAQANIATDKANESSASATASALSESNASLSESNASDSADLATLKASEALNSANIATSASYSASLSASTATTQADIATEKANEASQLLQQLQELGLVTQSSKLFTATGGVDEVFTLDTPYTIGSIYVYREGLLLTPTEFVAVDGTTVTILGETTAGESIYIMSFGTIGIISLPDTLTPSDIGSLVQGYDSNTVIDTNYVHTDNNYTTAEKTKLASLSNYTLPADVVQDFGYNVFKTNTNTALGYIPYNIKFALGGVYDASVDKTVELQSAIDSNPFIYIPHDVAIKVSSSITVHDGVTIIGEASRENSGSARASKIIYSNDIDGNTPIFKVSQNVTIKGINFYKEGATTAETVGLVGFGDIAIQAESGSVVASVEIDSCSFYGFNKAIDLQNYSTTAQTRGSWTISNCLFDSKVGIALGNCKDTMYLTNNHFYPFLGTAVLSSVSNDYVGSYARTSAIDIVGDADWIQVSNCFSHSYKTFISGDGFAGSIVGGGYDFEHYNGFLTDAIGVSLTNRDVNSTITGVTFNGGYRHIYINNNFSNGATPMTAITGCSFNSVYDSYLCLENGIASFNGNVAKEAIISGVLTTPNYIARVYNGSKILSVGNIYKLPSSGAIYNGNVGGTQIVQANNMEL